MRRSTGSKARAGGGARCRVTWLALLTLVGCAKVSGLDDLQIVSNDNKGTGGTNTGTPQTAGSSNATQGGQSSAGGPTGPAPGNGGTNTLGGASNGTSLGGSAHLPAGGSNSGGFGFGGTLTQIGGASTIGNSLAGGAFTTGGTPIIGGGASTTAGNLSTGGALSSGGDANTGGAPQTAASVNTGGVLATGGSPTGGSTGAAIGGAGATGGASSTGGTTATTSAPPPQHWVGTWTASPYLDTNASNTPPFALTGSVVRQVTHVSLGGSQIRVQFSNLWGDDSLVINGAHVALCKASPKVDSTIDTATDVALRFSGSAGVTIPPRQEVWSDPINFPLPNQGNVTITTLFGSVPGTLTQHSGSRTTSYFKAGGSDSDLSAGDMSSATAKALWFFISGIDVMADASAKGIVAIGDSITDGRGSDTDANNRWTDILAARLQGNAATANVSMMNQAIGATNLSGSSSTTAQSRFNRDALGMSGVKYVIILDGVNDIGSMGSSAGTLTSAYADLIQRAQDRGLLIYGGTILPFGGNSTGYDTPAHESVRQLVNTYIRTQGNFDGVIDFDVALRNPIDPTKLDALWGSTDGLHPGPAGHQEMGKTPDLTLFTK
jgi:lysophospholipase L1-like esterase